MIYKSTMKEVFFDFTNFIYHHGITQKFWNMDIKSPSLSTQMNGNKLFSFSEWVSSILCMEKVPYESSYYYLLSQEGIIFTLNIDTLSITNRIKLRDKPCGNIFIHEDKKYLLKQKSCHALRDNVSVLNKHNKIEKINLSYKEKVNVRIKESELYIKLENCLDTTPGKIFRFDKKIYQSYIDITFEDPITNTFVTKTIKTPFFSLNESSDKQFKYIKSVYDNLMCSIIVKYRGLDHTILVSKKTTKKVIDVCFSFKLTENIFMVEDDSINYFEFDLLDHCEYNEKYSELLDKIHGYKSQKCVPFGVIDDEKCLLMYNKFDGHVLIPRPYLSIINLDDKFSKKEILIELSNTESYEKYPFFVPRYADCVNKIIYDKKTKTYMLYNRINPHQKVRSIDYITSKDMVTWSKHKPINITGYDWNYDSHYIPNVMKYPGTDYYICVSLFIHTLKNHRELMILISKNGIDFDIISIPYSYYGGVHSDDYFPIVGGFIEKDSSHHIYMSDVVTRKEHTNYKKAFLHKFTFRLDSLFYICAENHGHIKTRPTAIFNNKLTINYKCNEGGYIKIRLTDELDNDLPKYSYDNCKSITSDDICYDVEWETNDYAYSYIDKPIVYIYIQMYNASIFSLSGQFTDPNVKKFTHVKFLVMNYLYETYLQRFKYSNVNLFKQYGQSAIKLVDKPFYENNSSIVYQNVLMENNEIKTVKLIDNSTTFVNYGTKKYQKSILLKEIELVNLNYHS
jgi:hypothetical protein